MIFFVLKVIVRGLFILLLIPLILALLLLSETVNRWVFEQVQGIEPRLELGLESGHLWRGWDFDRIVWRDEGIEVIADDIRFAWSPNCLFGARLCIDEVDVESIQVTSESVQESGKRVTINLPAIRLPLGVQVDKLRISSLRINSPEPLLTDIELAAHLRDSELVIQRFTGIGPDVDWQLTGDIRLENGWPLKIDARVNLPAVDEKPWTLAMRLRGSAVELDLEVISKGYLDGQLNAELQPLDPKVPGIFKWRGDRFVPSEELPETLVLIQSSLNARGNLEDGFDIEGNAVFPGQGGDIELDLSARASTRAMDKLDLALFVVKEPTRRLTLTGDASWKSELAANVQLELEQFPWQWLYPQDIGDIELEQLSLSASLHDNMQVIGSLKARLAGVAGQIVNVSMNVAGDQEQINITPFEVITDAGSATGEVALHWVEGLAWDSALLLDGLDPSAFIAELPGDLNGPLTSKGSLIGEQLELEAIWALEGTLRSQPLELAGSLDKTADTWQLDDLLLRQGQNRVTGTGTLSDQVKAQFDLQVPMLETLWPGLGGALKGTLNTSGPRSAPVVRTDLRGERLVFEQSSIAELSVQGNVTLSDETPGNVMLTAQQVRSGDTVIGDLLLTLRGNRQIHRLAIQVDDGIGEVDAQLQGSLLADRWQGQLDEAAIAYGQLEWQLAEPARINYRLSPAQLRIAEHCWRHEGARLCFQGEQRLLPDRQLDLALSNFSLSSLADLMPDNLAWNADMNASVQFQQAAGEAPVVDLVVRSVDGMVSLTETDQTLAFPYELLEITTKMQSGTAQSRIQLTSDGFGTFDIQANIDDPAGAQQLSGQYSIKDLKLNILRPFLPQVDTLNGGLRGNGRLAGTLRQPEVVGTLRLTEGFVSGPELPVSLEDLQVNIDINGQSAVVDGQWTSGEEGESSLTGTLVWAPELNLNLALKGRQLPVIVQPYADLLVSPDLQIALANNQLRIRGLIAVPEGNITVRELPEQAVRQSPDVVIVGEELEEEAPPLDIDARVQLVIGDQLNLSAFGLTGRLSGRIMVEENMSATGDLNILDGRFRRYGQRLTLRRARILFAGPISQPFLNIEAIRKVDDVVAGLRLTGRAEAPQSEVFSEPGMPQEQALAYLVLGRPLGADGGDNNLVGQAALALGMAGGAPLAKNIASTLGIQDFQLETEGTGVSTQVVAAGYITEKISLRYGVGVFGQANQLAVRYDLTRRLYLEAVSGFASSLDFFYRIDF
jgi:translocation and assembly module TamB